MLTVAGVAGVEGEGRTVHLPSNVAQLLAEYTSQIRLQMLPEGARSEDGEQPLVFHERRRPFERTGLYRRVVRILTAAGLGERASVQLLRHTYGYLAYLKTGGNLLFVQRQLGHAHPMVTSIYAQFVDEPYGELAERVGGGSGGYTSMALEPLEPRVMNTVEDFNSECD
jgi:site-specific recombinase XerD